MNDIEKEKRTAPKQTVIKKLSKFLDINIDELSIGDTIIAESVKLDDTLELISSTDMLIVSVTVPMKEVVTESDEELEDGEDTGSSEGASEEASSSDSGEGASDNSGDQ